MIPRWLMTAHNFLMNPSTEQCSAFPEWTGPFLSKAVSASELFLKKVPFCFPYFLFQWEHCWNGEGETQRADQRGLEFLAGVASHRQGDAPCWTASPSASWTPWISLLSAGMTGLHGHWEGWEPSTHSGRDDRHPHTVEGMRGIHTQKGYSRGGIAGGTKQPVPVCFLL